jgi:hypothetical protein
VSLAVPWWQPSAELDRNPLEEFQVGLVDVVTGYVLQEWRPKALRWFEELNGIGEGTVTIPLAQLAGVDPLFLSGPRAGFVIIENGFPQFYGSILDHDVAVGAGTVTLTAIETAGLLMFRRIRTDMRHRDREQTAIARALVVYAQQAPGGNLGITYGGVVATGQKRTRDWEASERASVGQELYRLTGVIGGFDLRFVPYFSGGRIWLRMHTDYPRAGRRSGVLLEHGSNATVTGLKISSRGVRQRWDGFGGDRDAPIKATATDWGKLGAVPLMEDAFTDTDVKALSTLKAKTSSRLATSTSPAVTPTFQIFPEQIEATVGALGIGDTCRTRADIPPYELDEDYRVTKLTHTVEANGRGIAAELEQAALHVA